MIPAETIQDVLNVVLVSGPKKESLLKKLTAIVPMRKKQKIKLPISNQRSKKEIPGMKKDPTFGIDSPKPTD